MVTTPRAPLGARDLRLLGLNAPAPIQVRVGPDGLPRAVRRAGWPGPRPVAAVQDRWRIDDEWWREHPVARLYLRLRLADDSLLTVYHDLLADRWYEQRA